MCIILHWFIFCTSHNKALSVHLWYTAVAPACPANPCLPSPCGPNSVCRVVDSHAVCSCQPGCVGSPPTCRPQCVVSSDCPQNLACINQKCQDPCPGTCGFNARCQVVNHNPICTCAAGFTGDPFARCLIQESKLPIFTSLFEHISIAFDLKDTFIFI